MTVGVTEEVFEILSREGLDTDDRVERAVMHDRRISDVMDLAGRLSEAVGTAETPAGATGRFDFVPNTHIAGHRLWCDEWGCRLRRVDRLARFAVLWADTVLVPSYFDEYSEGVWEFDPALRYAVAGDLKALVAIRPLLQSGIVRLFRPRFHICPACRDKMGRGLKEGEPAVGGARDRVYAQYVQQVSVRLTAQAEATEAFLPFDVHMAGPEELIPDGAIIVGKPEPPAWLPPRILGRIRRGHSVQYRVPSQRIRQVEEIRETVDDVLSEVVSQLAACQQLGGRYLTDRLADATFLDVLSDGSEYAGWNAVLAQHLEYDMPIIESVPLTELLRIRDAEHDAFLVYRDTMSRVIRDHIKGKPAPSGREAQEIYEDIVRPALNKLNAKVTSLRRGLADRLRITVPVTATALGVGLVGGLLPAAANDLLITAGGLGLGREALASLASLTGAPSELRNENFYFLWKIGEKAARRRKGGAA